MGFIWDTVLLVAVTILIAVWLEERNYSRAHNEVRQRWAAGDTTCAVRKKWYGWTVIEYAEEASDPL